MELRSPESHPSDRAQDQGWKARIKNWWGPGRGYRDLWMIAITIVVLFATQANHDNIEQTKQNAEDTKQLVQKTAGLTLQIQKSREEFFLYTCEQQNKRGKRTINRLNKLIKNDDRPNSQERKFFTLALIEELAPKQDCEHLVNQLVSIP